MGERHWLDALNASQREAVLHRGGPLLVVAGAGTGKTWTLACRVAARLEDGVPPERILLLTFSRRAAREMLARADRLTGGEAQGRVWGGTFHAVANRLLRTHGRSIGIPPDFTVLDQGDQADLMDLIRSDLRLGSGERRFPRKDTLATIYSRVVNAGERLGIVLERAFPWCAQEVDGIRAVFERYGRRKREHNVLDYDDLLLHWLALVRAPGVGDHVAGAFDAVLVDEYQDTNALQADILEALWRPGGDLAVVGDDAQAIYSFRAATVRNILEFPGRFGGARVVKLEQSYRSTPPIVAVANAVIALSAERHEKTLWTARTGVDRPTLVTCRDDAGQADEVCRAVLWHRELGVALREQAVLFRAAHHSDLLEVELTRRNIPFVKYGGLKFMETAHVKDLLATLRILENPFDVVGWFRVLQLLEGVGPATARRLLRDLGSDGDAGAAGGGRDGDAEGRAADRAGGGDVTPLRRLLDAPPAVPPAAGPDLAELRAALEDCADDRLPPAGQIARLRRFLEPVFLRRYPSPASRLRDVEQLERVAGGYASRGRFLADLALDPPASTADLAGPPLLDEDYLILSTIHSAKGGEWDVVHLIHAVDGMIPSDMATGDAEQVEEERRLLYVALTRARDALHVYAPLRYYRRPRGLDDGHGYAQVTRFLPTHVRQLFDERTAHVDDERVPASAVPGGGRIDVDAFLAGLWE